MKSKVMNRPMFLDVENVGIMQGFKDEDYETGAMIDRTPSSPEILMNNLRGDMRSVDARIQELADLVGMDIASDTPPEILALLQPVLAEQEGIASLPAGMPDQPMGDTPPMTPPPMGDAMPAPDMGMMPPEMGMPPPQMGMPPPQMGMPPDAGMMPQGPMPTAQAPLNMAQGGYVQRFRDGSDEEGVTPDDDDQGPPMSIDPATARAQLMNLRARQQSALPTLEEEMKSRLPEYQKLLGSGDRKMTQSQILFDIAQAGLNLAAGTDAAGKPVRPGASFASRLAGAAQALPERVAARVGQLEQDERGVRLAALKASESSIEDQRKMYAKLMEGAGSPFGKGAWDYRTVVELTDAFVAGQLDPQQERQYIAAATKLLRPSYESYVNEQGFRVTKEIPGMNLPFVLDALNQRGMTGGIAGASAPQGGAVVTSQPIAETMPPDWVPMGEPTGRTQAGVPDIPPAITPRAPVAPPAAPVSDPENTLWGASNKAIGLYEQLTARLGEAVPFNIAGQFSSDVQQATSAIQTKMTEFETQYRNTGRLSEQERKRVERILSLDPKLLQNEAAYKNRLISIGLTLNEFQDEARRKAQAPSATATLRNEQMAKAEDLQSLLDMLGLPPFVTSSEQLMQIPVGAPVLLKSRDGNWIPTTRKQ
jgi:hypothetical protein